MSGTTDNPVRDWAASGAMWLTGLRDGVPLPAPGDPAGRVRRDLDRVRVAAEQRTGRTPDLPGLTLLGERAAIAGLSRNGPWSCGGAFRSLRSADGWIGLSLPRPSDLDLVPALVETATDPGAAWAAVADWARRTTSAEAVARARLLGLACVPVGVPDSEPEEPRHPGGVTISDYGTRPRSPHPLVVDLTSLWAGPLCGHLLGLTGAEVVKVESTRRPDGTRRGPAAFFDLLHHGHASVGVDLRDPHDLARLRRLIGSADLVLEASRPRALHQAGLVAEEFLATGVSWLSITAAGRGRARIGFGDDVATGAGLVARAPGTPDPLPCGDAVADPLAGVAAAAAASELLLGDRVQLIDVSMHHVAASTVTAPAPRVDVVPSGDGYRVVSDLGEFEVAPPRARTAAGPARRLGADNADRLR